MKKILKKNFGFTPPLLRGAGFTLIEFLLGFLIFSIIMVALYSTFFSGMKIEERSLGEAASYAQVKMSLDMISRELERVVRFDFSNSSPELKTFEGTSSEISFLMTDKNGIKRVSYYLKDKDKVKIHQILIGEHYKTNVSVTNVRSEEAPATCLMRSEQSLVDFISGNNSSALTEEVLLDNVRRDSFNISYAYLEAKGDSTYLVWQNVWDKDYIPSGIRLEMTLVPLKKGGQPIDVKKDIYIPTGFWGEAS